MVVDCNNEAKLSIPITLQAGNYYLLTQFGSTWSRHDYSIGLTGQFTFTFNNINENYVYNIKLFDSNNNQITYQGEQYFTIQTKKS
jgi:hypothetical protein